MTGTTARHRARLGLLAGLLLLLASHAQAAETPAGLAVGEALGRPALVSRQVGHSVLEGAALAGRRIVAVGERGIVALSEDGGSNWRQAPTPVSVTLTAVRFADPRHGWAVGHGGVVLTTDDSGEHWSRQLDGRRAAQIVLDAARAGNDARALQDAERLVADGPDKPWLDLLVQDRQHLVVVGAFGMALASEDGGKTWASWMARLPNPQGLHIYAARQRGQTVLLAGEQGLAMLSRDGGQSFRRIETGYKGSFFSAELLGEQDLLLAGLRGTVLRSADGGANWAEVSSPMPVSITATTLTGDGRLLAANQAGFILLLQGDRLVPLNPAPLPPLNGLLAGSGAPLLALSVAGALPVPLKQGATP